MKKIMILVLLSLFILQAESIGVDEKLGNYVSLDLTFIDEEGKSKTLREYMDGKAAIVSLNYFRCAGICTPQLEDMAKMLSRLELIENVDYKALTISFAPNETPDLAKAKKKTHIDSMGKAYEPQAWRFLLTENNSSAIFSKEVGFSYKKTVSKAGVIDWIHAAALIVISPEGKITRYLNGIEQNPFDVKMAVIESTEGKVGPTIAKTLLYCFAYDPKGKTYIFKWEKIVGIIMTSIMLLFFIYLVKTSKRDDSKENYDRNNQSNKGDN